MNLSHLPSQLSLAVGDSAQIALPTAAGGGYVWQAVCGDGADIAEVNVIVGPLPQPAKASGGEPPPMALAIETAVVQALRPGTATWNLVLVRPFGAPAPLAQHGLRVEVVSVG